MPHRILFSLPVHERPDIVQGQLENIRSCCPDAVTCLHISSGATVKAEEFRRLASLPNVLVNPHTLNIVFGKGLLHVHAANFLYAQSVCSDIETVALISSNELFVRDGLEGYVKGYAAGAQIEICDPLSGWHAFRRDIDKDSRVKALLSHLGLGIIFGGQTEGQFYKAPIFAEMVKLFFKFFEAGPSGFESEEILTQTMAVALLNQTQAVAPPFTFVNYGNFVAVDEALVDLVRSGRGFIFSPRRTEFIRSPHISTNDLSSIFSVKRVPRRDCAIRNYIYSLTSAAVALQT